VTTVAEAPATRPPESASGTGERTTTLGPPESRGRTEIAGRVLERIAGQALSEVDQAGGASRRVLGVPLGRDELDSGPQVSAHVDGELATVRMTVSVVYPAPVREVTRNLRTHVMERIRDLTGIEVRQVDIDVAHLVPPPEHGRRVL
jgi:uncharacterized alkaline shock family protein YloU